MADVIELLPSSHSSSVRGGAPAQVVDLAAARRARRHKGATASPLPVDPLLFWQSFVAFWASLWLAPLGLRVAAVRAETVRHGARRLPLGLAALCLNLALVAA